MRIFCSICKEIFIPYSEVKITDCGHLYHGSCISRWTTQHRTCPQCRTNITKPFRVFFDVEKDNDTDPSTLEHQVETLSDKLRESESLSKNLRKENENYERIMEGMKECALALKQKNDVLKTSIKALKDQVTHLSKQSERVSNLESEVEKWKNKVKTLQRVEMLINGSSEEVNKMIETTPITELAVRQLCTYVGIMKVQLSKNEVKYAALVKENRGVMKLLAEEKKKNSTTAEEVVKKLKMNYSSLEKELQQTKKLLKENRKQAAEDKEAKVSLVKDVKQIPKAPLKRPTVFDLDLDFLDNIENKQNGQYRVEEFSKNVVVKPSLDSDFLENVQKPNNDKSMSKDILNTVSHWEELVCAGPSRNLGSTVNKSKFCQSFSGVSSGKDLYRPNSYAFDGLGGRKKIRLGGPTPREEFEKIKKKEERKSVPAVKHKKITEYCKIE